MKLHASQNSGLNIFTSYGHGYVSVNGVRYESSVLVVPRGDVRLWHVADPDALVQDDFQLLANLRPELVLLGTGETLRFPHPRTLMTLTAAGIGTEVMDSRAACRTYNILAGEGREVAAALILPGA
ncbi:MAG TPA: Mth938-like domain-containing protein [Burkholderiales bacterium]|nr:Mth938-like domain-containing protein [Burkholderiales bacterium]